MFVRKHHSSSTIWLFLAPLIALSALSIPRPAFGQRAEQQSLPSPSGELLIQLESVYKDIHAHPELASQEERTAGIAANWLREQGYEVTEGVGKTGIVGLLRNGEGPTVLLRADMDALPMKENTGLPYASTKTGIDPSTGRSRIPAGTICT
jgi:hippurate hydrolase